MPQFIFIPTVTKEQHGLLIEVYSSAAGLLTKEHEVLLGKNITSETLGLMPHGLVTSGQNVIDLMRSYFIAKHLNADWVGRQRLYSIGRCEGESIKLGLAIALLLHGHDDPELDIIATGNLVGYKGAIKVVPVAKVAEKFQLVLKERQANKLNAKKIVFFTPQSYLDDNGNEQPISDLQDEINQLASVGIDVKPISHVIEIFSHLKIAIPNYSEKSASNQSATTPDSEHSESPIDNHKQNSSAPRRFLTIRKIALLSLAAILVATIARYVQIPEHHEIGEFNQITHYTLVDKLKELGERISSLKYYLSHKDKQSHDFKQPLSIMIVYSEKAPYEEAIVNSFLKHLNNKVWTFNQAIETEPYYNPDGTEKDIEKWSESIENRIARTDSKKVDYFITLGTFVTKAVRDNNFIKKYNAKGIIFLGVTDPVKSKLVTQLNNRQEDTNITGVRYGSDKEDDYGATIGSIFPPAQRLVFVYDEKLYPQDGFVAGHLRDFIKKNKATRFELRPKDSEALKDGKKIGFINLNDLNRKQPNDPPEVYFAWYGLDNVLRDNVTGDGLAALNTKWVIPSTYSTDNLDRAGIIVSVSDQEVGRLGADIVFKSYLNPKLQLGHEPVATTLFLIWLDCEVIKHKKEGLRLATPLPNATEIRNIDACPSIMQ